MLYVLTGPESCGKSTLATQLAGHFDWPLVAEQARAYFAQNLVKPGKYQPSDLLNIGDWQNHAERAIEAGQDGICDTDLQVIYIWWRERFGPAPKRLAQAYAGLSPRYYLLCEPDLDWQSDPLRENPEDRQRLYKFYEQDLRARELPYAVITGQGQARLRCAVEAINAYRSS